MTLDHLRYEPFVQCIHDTTALAAQILEANTHCREFPGSRSERIQQIAGGRPLVI